MQWCNNGNYSESYSVDFIKVFSPLSNIDVKQIYCTTSPGPEACLHRSAVTFRFADGSILTYKSAKKIPSMHRMMINVAL